MRLIIKNVYVRGKQISHFGDIVRLKYEEIKNFIRNLHDIF